MGRIAFNVEWGPDQEPNVKNIWSIEPDGSGLQRLSEVTDQKLEGPAWTPDGRQIVFALENGDANSGRIHRMDASGASLTAVGSGSEDFEPTVSHDGLLIAFVHDDPFRPGQVVPNEGRIFLMGFDGTGRRPLTKHVDGAEDGFPSFSPDNRMVAFDRQGAIWVINVDGTGLHQVVPDSASAQRPRWSPDGLKLAYSVGGDGPDDHVVVLDLATGADRDLGPGGQPDWSPDGQWLAFWRWAPATRHLALVVSQADGSRPTEIMVLTDSMLPIPQSWDWGLRAVSWGSAP